MRCKTILVALLVLAFQAQATHVSQSDAASAARVWAGAGSALGIRLGANVESVQEHAVTNGYSFYAVKLGGGTVIMTSDTDLEPVVAFSPNVDLDLSEGSPLLDLLRKDIAARAALAGASSGAAAAVPVRSKLTATASSSASRSAASASAATVPRPGASLWGKLMSASQQTADSSTTPSKRLLASSARPVTSVSDVRVAPLLESKWSQYTVDNDPEGDLCYNYYTPNNWYCGCSATAAAQIMRYFKFPVDDVEPREYECVVGDTPTKLKMQGGIYDWENMTLVPKEGITEEECEAIGKLTSDVGIALKSEYGATGTNADPDLLASALRDTFGYADAICYWNEAGWDTGKGGLHDRDMRTRVILANLDARQPVQLSIYGYAAGHVGNSLYWAGHSVVADGYGYQTVADVETEFVHINMGWGGTDDVWYNIPMIDAANTGAHAADKGYTFLYLGGATFNISAKGDAGLSILSGRITDDDGVATPGARVSVYDDADAKVAETVSDKNGIYFFKLPGDAAYLVEAVSADGKCMADVTVDNLPATKNLTSSYCVYADNNVGNSWGNDMVLAPPSVRVGEEIFSSIDSALVRARAIATPGTPVVVEVFDATKLKRAALIDFDCVIVATSAAPSESPVVCRSGAQFVVASGATLAISNVVFSSAGSTLVDVADGGMLAIAGGVDFGASAGIPAVRTAAATGLRVLGGIEHGFMLDCSAATEFGDTFGYAYATDVGVYAAITGSVSRIANFADEDRELRGSVTGSPPLYPLKWLPQAVPVEDSIGYFVDASGETNTAGRIDKLFDLYSAALERGDIGDERRIVIRESGSLSRPLSVSADTSIVGEGVEIDLGGESSAGFTVTGGELSVSGISFANYVGNALFLVNGEGASLSLGQGTALTDIEGTNKWSGAVTVLKGSASATGATFTNCCATGKYSPTMKRTSNGGAFYLEEGTSLTLEDVSATGCWANGKGGAVYAKKGATVSLAGRMYVSGNTAGNFYDDVFLVNGSGNRAKLTLSGVVTGSVGVRLSEPAGGYGNTSGLLFADAASAVVAHASAAAFFCDNNATVVAEPDDAVSALRWAAASTGPQPCDPEEASVRVEYADGKTEKYYLLVAEGLVAAPDGATVYIVGRNGNELTSDVVVTNKITLASDLEIANFWLARKGDCSIVVGEGASLTLRDISVFGLPVDDTGALATNMYGYLDYGYYGDYMTTSPLFKVHGGSLTLATPSKQCVTEIAGVLGQDTRDGGAVSVGSGGKFFMESGSCIRDCENWYSNYADGTGRGGAVLVDDGRAVFSGGTIERCRARSGGGVFVGNNGTVSVSGDVRIVDNRDLFGNGSNLLVHDLGRLTLAGKMTGAIGYTEGVAGDKVVFGKVASGVSAADAQSSAHRFTHDVTGDVGMAVTGQGGMLLVWSDGLDSNGVYTDDDNVAHSLVVGEAYAIDVPVARTGLVYDGMEWTGVEEGLGYTLSDNTAVNAGGYVAKATPKAGFKWADGTTEVKAVDWSIAKAKYDMSGVSFNNMTVVYGGQYYELVVSGELPVGVRVSYANNRQREVGVYTATASFSGDAENYEAIADMKATLTILAQAEPTPPSPTPPPTPPAQPLPVAFLAIAEADGTWTLSVTTAVEKCWYSLYATNSLSEGFGIEGVEPVELRQAGAADVPTMIFTQPSDGSALFWKVVAEPEDAH